MRLTDNANRNVNADRFASTDAPKSSARPSFGEKASDSKSVGQQAISFPKGGGAIRGLGEKFSVNSSNGSASLSIPIPVSPGRDDFEPELELSYDSGNGNGSFGLGWSLNLPKIARKTDKGIPRYDDFAESDTFILSGSEDLVPVTDESGLRIEDTQTSVGFTIHRYRPRVEGLFARIERWTEQATGQVHWRSISRDNVTSIYGRDKASQITDNWEPNQNTTPRIFEWLVTNVFDDKGNAILYEYQTENDESVDTSNSNERNRYRKANCYLKRIKYGNKTPHRKGADLRRQDWLFEIVFDYGESHCLDVAPIPGVDAAKQHTYVQATAANLSDWNVRPDPFSNYRAGFEIRTYRRCSKILMFHHFDELGPDPYLVKSIDFGYVGDSQESSSEKNKPAYQSGYDAYISLTRSITLSGFVRDENLGSAIHGGVRHSTYLKKSLPPVEFQYSTAEPSNHVTSLDAESVENLPKGVDGKDTQWIDLDGEGLSGVMIRQAGDWSYKPNLGRGELGPAHKLDTIPTSGNSDTPHGQWLDLSGDGQLDFVTFTHDQPGFYERTPDGGWQPFRAFESIPNIAWNDPDLRFIDLSGDGRADVAITSDDVLTWYSSRGEDGFDASRENPWAMDEESGPRLMFSDISQSIFLADMTGDGLTDFVRIKNGEICYWPNMGHGDFGAKIAMDNAPIFDQSENFSPNQIRLADVDGSGPIDIIYLGNDGVSVFQNFMGNAWSNPISLNAFPKFDSSSAVSVSDLLGDGTACLIWSSPLPANTKEPIRYLRLMGKGKPHLLKGIANNLGVETHVEYKPSTEFYLDDKKAGKPWITKLPFPVHVVHRVTTDDKVSHNTLVQTYSYHHGYFDPDDREFRGFGLVQQYDTETMGRGIDTDYESSLKALARKSESPPILTKTWFHTGIYFGRNHVSDYFAGLFDVSDTGEYFREPGLSDNQVRSKLLEDTVIPSALTLKEEREACRSLKGSLLRQEIYALDGTDKEPLPYKVVEKNYGIAKLQSSHENVSSVFMRYDKESITYDYEREVFSVVDKTIQTNMQQTGQPIPSKRCDPRTNHEISLEVDEYGNNRKKVQIAYGRTLIDPQMPSNEDAKRQAQNHVIYEEQEFTDAIDSSIAHRTPVPYETRRFELTNFVPTEPNKRYLTTDFGTETVATGTVFTLNFETELQYEDAPDSTRARRLTDHQRTLFRRDDLAGPLPLGQWEPLAIPYESYTLALTPRLVEKVYEGNVGQSDLTASEGQGGGYVQLLDEAGTIEPGWWRPSGTSYFSNVPNDAPDSEKTHAEQHFYRARRQRNPFHTDSFKAESHTYFDKYDLLTDKMIDPVGNENRVLAHNYRALQPKALLDPNQNETSAKYDAFGQLTAVAVKGKTTGVQSEGDRFEDSFVADLTYAEIDRFFLNPTSDQALNILDGATRRTISDPTWYWRHKDSKSAGPIFAIRIERETHGSQAATPASTNAQIHFQYMDGFGRDVQKKSKAAPGPAPLRNSTGRIIVGNDGEAVLSPDPIDSRWIASGWTVYNNKAKPVRQFEPFFSDTHRFDFDTRIGRSPVFFYDPLSRIVGTLLPNHSWTKVEIGAWNQAAWDESDTVLADDPTQDNVLGYSFRQFKEHEYLPTWHQKRIGGRLGPHAKRSAEKSAVCANTPELTYFDSLGRTFLALNHNKWSYSAGFSGDRQGEARYAFRSNYDIAGNLLSSEDPKARTSIQYVYDMSGTRILEHSADSGKKAALLSSTGEPVMHWTERGHRFRYEYDQLRRHLHRYVRFGSAPEFLAHRTVYGDNPVIVGDSRIDVEKNNLRLQVYEEYDQSGLQENVSFDFKGNLLRSERRYASTYKDDINWLVANHLEDEVFTSLSRFDALNRIIQLVPPHSPGADVPINVIQPSYNESNQLKAVDVWLTVNNVPAYTLNPVTLPPSKVGLSDITYNARGQRTSIAYKNGATTQYSYDADTFRLRNLYTRRGSTFTEDCENPTPPPAFSPAPPVAPAGAACGVQNLHYTYDVTGNITHIQDLAQQKLFFRNQHISADTDYTYDALARLIEAAGREHLGQSGGVSKAHSYNDFERLRLTHPNDVTAMGHYLERYVYDEVGNALELYHTVSGPSPSWHKTFRYNEASSINPAETSNRLSSTIVGPESLDYGHNGQGYDPHGNMLRSPHLSAMRWNYDDQLIHTRRQAVSQEDEEGTELHGELTWYTYNASGERVRKVTERNGIVKEVRLYLGTVEVLRNPDTNRESTHTLHIMDDEDRIALVETKTASSTGATDKSVTRYQLTNHLGSACLELDDEGKILSYEEYTPYGSTTYQAVAGTLEAPKRYRFTGKERDRENGFTYHGARYYAPWLMRWISADPAGPVDGPNLYLYGRANPVSFVDPTGNQASPYSGSELDPTVGSERQTLEAKPTQDGMQAKGRDTGPQETRELGSPNTWFQEAVSPNPINSLINYSFSGKRIQYANDVQEMSVDAQAQIRQATRNRNLPQANSAAKQARKSRESMKIDSQNKLKWGAKKLSRTVDEVGNKNTDFWQKASKQLPSSELSPRERIGRLKRVHKETPTKNPYEIARRVAVGAGSTNRTLNAVAKASRKLGPIGTAIGMLSNANKFIQAQVGDRARVAGSIVGDLTLGAVGFQAGLYVGAAIAGAASAPAALVIGASIAAGIAVSTGASLVGDYLGGLAGSAIGSRF